MFVVDASVAVKWFIEEPDSDQALQMKDDAVFLVLPQSKNPLTIFTT